MPRFSRAVVAFVAFAGVSCSGGVKPVEVAAGDMCFRCRRVIAEKRIAAEMIDASSLAYKFRGPGCLAKYLADHPNEKGTLFVTDYATGRLISPDRALFVSVVTDERTNERDYRAYLDKASAEAVARSLNVATADWNGVLAANKG